MVRRIAVFVSIVVSLAACTTPIDREQVLGAEPITAQAVVQTSPLGRRAGAARVEKVDLLELSPAMKAFLDENVNVTDNHDEQLRRLGVALIGSGEFELVYDDSTRTARETFEARRGNCFSFTTLFVAMAREVGLDARYQEAEIPPNWSMTGQAYVFSQHINAYIDLLNGRTRVVDFNAYDYVVEQQSKVISDARAAAHFYNNLGAELMLADRSAEAYAHFRQSLLQDPTFAPGWVNIGILHRREGYPQYAEAAYLEALRVDPDSQTAMSNLAYLYQETERPELAAEYLARVQAHRMRNPYYRFHLAGEAFAEGDYDAAIRHLKYAYNRRKDESEFCHLLSLSYLMKGDRPAARRWMEAAEEAARAAADRERYHHKLDLLRSLGSG
jgi:Flp pilus assembly protein TadD